IPIVGLCGRRRALRESVFICTSRTKLYGLFSGTHEISMFFTF
ncbi:unnamed protein product, partial [Arabidopsis halleri]